MACKYVYFITPKDDEGPIKIGCSAEPKRRLHHLMAWSPSPLCILHTISGGFDMESRIQGHFSRYHLHAEWFSPAPELVEFIERLKAGVPVESLIDMSLPIRGTASITIKKNHPSYPEYQSIRVKFSHAEAEISRKGYLGDRALERSCKLADDILKSWSGNGRYCEDRPPAPQLEFVERVTDHLKLLKQQLREAA